MFESSLAVGSTVAQTILGWLATYIVHSSVMIGAVWAFTKGCRLDSLTRSLLWKLALVGGLFTSTLQTGFGVRPLFGSVAVATAPQPGLAAPTPVDAGAVAAEPAPARGCLGAECPGTLLMVDALDVGERAELAALAEFEAFEELEALEALEDLEDLAIDIDIPAIAVHVETTPDFVRTQIVMGPSEPVVPMMIAEPPPPPPIAAAPVAPAAPAGGDPTTLLALVGLFFAGAIASLARLGFIARRLRRALRGRTSLLDGPLRDRLNDLLARARVGRDPVQLSLSAGVHSPIALANREIVVPARALDLAPRQQEAMLAHELAHVVRKDPAWLILAAIIEAALFIQPLNRVARRGMQEAAEDLCDDWAVRHTGTGLHLARCLAEVAGWLERGRSLGPLASPMAEAGSALMHRVRRLLDAQAQPRGLTPRLRLLLGTGLVIAVALFAPGVSLSARAETPPLAVLSLTPEHEELPMPGPVLAFTGHPGPIVAPVAPSSVIVVQNGAVIEHERPTLKQRRLARRAARLDRKAQRIAERAARVRQKGGITRGPVRGERVQVIYTDGSVRVERRAPQWRVIDGREAGLTEEQMLLIEQERRRARGEPVAELEELHELHVHLNHDDVRRLEKQAEKLAKQAEKDARRAAKEAAKAGAFTFEWEPPKGPFGPSPAEIERIQRDAQRAARDAQREAERAVREAHRAAEQTARINEQEARRIAKEARREVERGEVELRELREEVRRELERSRPSDAEIRRLKEDARREAERNRVQEEEIRRLKEEARRGAERAAKAEDRDLRRLQEDARRTAKRASKLSDDELRRLQEEARRFAKRTSELSDDELRRLTDDVRRFAERAPKISAEAQRLEEAARRLSERAAAGGDARSRRELEADTRRLEQQIRKLAEQAERRRDGRNRDARN